MHCEQPENGISKEAVLVQPGVDVRACQWTSRYLYDLSAKFDDASCPWVEGNASSSSRPQVLPTNGPGAALSLEFAAKKDPTVHSTSTSTSTSTFQRRAV